MYTMHINYYACALKRSKLLSLECWCTMKGLVGLLLVLILFSHLVSLLAMADHEFDVQVEHNDGLICNDCPPWTKSVPITNYRSEQNRINCQNCECGNSLGGVVKCNKTTKEVKLLACYCMSQSKVLNKTIIGNCLYQWRI